MIEGLLNIKSPLPIAPLRETVIFPGNIWPIQSARIKSKAAIDASFATEDKLIVFVTQKNKRIDNPGPRDM